MQTSTKLTPLEEYLQECNTIEENVEHSYQGPLKVQISEKFIDDTCRHMQELIRHFQSGIDFHSSELKWMTISYDVSAEIEDDLTQKLRESMKATIDKLVDKIEYLKRGQRDAIIKHSKSIAIADAKIEKLGMTEF